MSNENNPKDLSEKDKQRRIKLLARTMADVMTLTILETFKDTPEDMSVTIESLTFDSRGIFTHIKNSLKQETTFVHAVHFTVRTEKADRFLMVAK